MSIVGSGGVIAGPPDIPINFQSTAATSASLIVLTWTQGPTYYGSPVIDYGISYDLGLGDGSKNLIEAGITDTTYSLTNVVKGTTYTFHVQARSDYSYSEYSTSLSVLAA